SCVSDMMLLFLSLAFFFFNATATTEIYTLSLHDALPICPYMCAVVMPSKAPGGRRLTRSVPRCQGERGQFRGQFLVHPDLEQGRSEEHTSELQSPYDLVCRLLLEKKKKKNKRDI